MRHRNKHLFVSALTGNGLCSFWDDVLADLRRLYFLVGGSPGEVSTFLRMIGHVLSERGLSVIYCHRPGSRLALEGLVIDSLGAAVQDGACKKLYRISPHRSLCVVDVEFPCKGQQRRELLEGQRDDCEAVMLLEEANRLWKEICLCPPCDVCSWFEGDSGWLPQEVLEKPSRIRRFFAGSLSAEGVFDFIDHLTSGCSKRYYLSGVPGRGGPVMQRVLLEGIIRRWEAEAYYSFLDLRFPVVLIFPEIALAVVDGTSHFAPSSWAGDAIWELEGVRGETRNLEPAAEIEGIQAKLNELLKAAGSALSCTWQNAGATGVTWEDAEAFVSRFLVETAVSV
ncbi:MAG: hypothetical protein ACPLTR_09235 [Thermacetogeniaceae bacterium]